MVSYHYVEDIPSLVADLCSSWSHGGIVWPKCCQHLETRKLRGCLGSTRINQSWNYNCKVVGRLIADHH